MNTMATLVSATLVGVGILAELNLFRMFASDWREGRRQHARRLLREAKARQFATSAQGRQGVRHGRVAAALLCGVIPSAALAQASATSTSATVPAPEQPKLDSQPTLTLQPSIPSEPTPLVISTDRPSFSDGTGFVPMGHFQIETGYTFTFRNRDGVETQRHNAPEILARLPLIEDRLELRLITSGYTWSRTNDGSGAGFESSAGWNDLSLGFKLKLADQDGWLPRLALGAQTTLGVGSDNVSNQIAEPTLKLLWSYDLGQSFGDDWKGVTLGGNANIAWPTSDGQRFIQGQGSVYVAFPIIDRLSGFAEYYVIGPNSKGTDAAHYADFGAAYLLNDRVQLDARVGFGLNRTADNLIVGVGISFLF